MKIKIKFNGKPIDNAENEIVTKKRQISKKTDEALRKVVEAAAEIARQEYAGTDVQVTVEKTDRGYKIVASAEDVAFVEFGAGDDAGKDIEHAPSDLDISPGSWSSSELGKGIYARHGHWHYGGKDMTGIEPKPGLNKAIEYIELNTSNVFVETFRYG